MGQLSEFTKAQQRELLNLDLCNEQIEKLRFAVVFSRVWLHKPAAKNDVAALLDEVAVLSGKLARKLRALNGRRDAAHGSANNYLEVAYWSKRTQDDGPTAAHHLCPRLDALHDSAGEAKASLPAGPARFRAASPLPVEKIDSALRDGWRVAHGSGVSNSPKLPASIPPVYPKRLKPSASSGSVFLRICCICYTAAGRGDEANPERAIKAYMRQVGKVRQEAILAFEKGIRQESRNRNRRTKRT